MTASTYVPIHNLPEGVPGAFLKPSYSILVYRNGLGGYALYVLASAPGWEVHQDGSLIFNLPAWCIDVWPLCTHRGGGEFSARFVEGGKKIVRGTASRTLVHALHISSVHCQPHQHQAPPKN